jgi:hypothetical protein
MKVAAVLNFIWTLPAHRAAFHAIARARGAASREAAAADNDDVAEEEEDRFVSFANGIIGHTTGVLTEALKGLPVIRDTLRSMGQPEVWGALDEEERGRRTSQLDETASLVKSSLLLAAQMTPLLAVLTEDRTICQEFMRGELVGRLAAMLIKRRRPRGHARAGASRRPSTSPASPPSSRPSRRAACGGPWSGTRWPPSRSASR